MIRLFQLLILSLMFSCIYTGPLGAGIWSSTFSSCVAGCALAGPAYAACVAACASVGPFASLIACFSNSTFIQTNSEIIPIYQLRIGTKVLTESIEGKTKQTEVVAIIQTMGNEQFVYIQTKTRNLTVTVNHVMISGKNLIKAGDLKIGEEINNQTITKLKRIIQDNKYTILTKEGTLLANGILTSTICGDYVDAHGNGLEVLEKWRKDHALLLE